MNRKIPVIRPERMRKCNEVAESKVFSGARFYLANKVSHQEQEKQMQERKRRLAELREGKEIPLVANMN